MNLAAYDIVESTQAGAARRGAMSLARDIGLDEVEVGRVGIVVTEATTNMVKHAEGGRLLVQPIANGEGSGVETLALDSGPGLARVAEVMRDGFSTSGTPGTGLGAIRRQSNQFEMWSAPGKGTALFSRVWTRDHARGTPPFAIGGVSVPMRGEELCGDAWARREHEGRTILLVVDGLGHGVPAHDAARAAIEVFGSTSEESPHALMELLHGALRPTRGAAAAVVRLDPVLSRATFCGVGNIEASIVHAGGVHHLVSHFGTLGHQVRKIRAFEYAFPHDATLVLHSDGVSRRWDFSDYPGLLERHPALVAGVLYRDHQRERDDATVVVVRRIA